jgi:hypothetical protein
MVKANANLAKAGANVAKCSRNPLQLTWFVAGLVLDTRRVDAGRYDAIPCLKRAPREDEEENGGLGIITRLIDR